MILLTGSSGFIGKHLVSALGESFKQVSRNLAKGSPNCFSLDINSKTNWSEVLEGVTSIVHVAGAAHGASSRECEEVNFQGTVKLAKSAVESGVERFIFISSIGVNGYVSDKPFTAKDKVSPHDDYALSKNNAEIALTNIAKDTGMKVVIIRFPLVYGNGATGSFRTLTNVISSGWPLPLKGIRNKRSIISVYNAVDLINHLLKKEEAVEGVVLASDGASLSTTELVNGLAKCLDLKVFLFSINWLPARGVFSLLGLSKLYSQLFCNLEIDNNDVEKRVGWKPPFSFEESLNKMKNDLKICLD